nr:RNA-directed DNA polymerase, eukaryota [Tanacetum cinerariifolium]
MFAFVRLIRVDDIDRLVGNLCTIWIRFHLYANVVRYERVSKPVKPSGFTHTSAQDNSGSYATAVRGNVPLNIPRTPSNTVSALVLDDSCAAERDLSRHVIGRVKDLNSISNLRILLTKEGSLKVKLSYLGGLWVMIEVDNVATKQNLLKHFSVNSWFHSLQDAFHDFVSDERIVWVDIEGKVTMVRAKELFTWNPIFVEPKESVFISDDDSVQGIKSIPDGLYNSDEESEDDSDNDCGTETLLGENSPSNVRSEEIGKQHSDDPFKIYDLLNKQPTGAVYDTSSSLSHPPGFTLDISQVSKGDVAANDVVKETTPLVNAQVMYSSQEVHESSNGESAAPTHSKVLNGGSILEVLEDMIRVGHSMGYNLEGCMKDIECIIGESGGILCMWEASVFKKDYATFFDNFIAIYGTWLPCNTKVLMVNIYAPQQPSARRVLWEYTLHLLDRWNGEAIVMGDFNDVYYKGLARCSINLILVRLLSGFIIRGLVWKGLMIWWSKLGFPSHFDSNRMIRFKKKLQDLKIIIRRWVKDKKLQQCTARSSIKEELSVIDKDLDRGQVSDDALLKRMELIRQLHDINQMESKDTFHKSKIKWAIKGDENTKFFHGIINKKRSQLSIREVFADGIWCTSPDSVKDTFKNHFEARFQQAKHDRFILNTSFNKRLSSDQVEEMDRGVSRDEIRRAIWNYGENKSPVEHFFTTGTFQKACNSSFIALIPKVADAKFVFDFRPISLIGCKTNIGWPFYLNEVLNWCKRNMKQSMFFKVDFTKAYDSVRWGYLLDVLLAFGFGPNWCRWIHGSFSSAMASILVNGSPMFEFPLCCGLKQGDPLSPYLFILIMESLHISFSRTENGLIRICITSLIFLNVFLASGLKINIQKSQVLGIGVPHSTVVQVADTIGCTVMHSEFRYLGVRVDSPKICAHMSIFKVPKGVLKAMEAIRCKFFYRADSFNKKITWVAWDKVLASRKNGGLGVSSFHALNCALLLKWVSYSFIWCSILREDHVLKGKGFDFFSYCKKRVEDGVCTRFWSDVCISDVPLRDSFPRLFALETDKDASVVFKLGAGSIASSFRREDRWICDLSGDGDFKVKVVCNFLDEMFLPSISVATRWLKCIPIKINIFAWRARRDSLLTRYDLSHRGVVLDLVLCPICGAAVEDIQHVLFRCELA